jgi:N-formylglutamate amidohydrolase
MIPRYLNIINNNKNNKNNYILFLLFSRYGQDSERTRDDPGAQAAGRTGRSCAVHLRRDQRPAAAITKVPLPSLTPGPFTLSYIHTDTQTHRHTDTQTHRLQVPLPSFTHVADDSRSPQTCPSLCKALRRLSLNATMTRARCC